MVATAPRAAAPSSGGTATRFDLRAAMAVAFVTTAALYLATMSRCVGFVDRGELAAVAWTLGIAHPTGYPTLTMLGHLASRAWPGNPLLGLNVFTALCVAGGAAATVALAARMMRLVAGTSTKSSRGRHGKPAPSGPGAAAEPAPDTDPAGAVLALLAALLLATGSVWWQQAMGFEAYGLHALLLPLVLLTCLRWVETERLAPVEPPFGRAFVFGLTLGLSLTNHMTTLLALPALLAATLLGAGWRRTLQRAPWIAFGVVIGLLPYAYLPIRAAARPRFNWGGVDTWPALMSHLGAWQYRVWMFTGMETFRRQLGFVAATLPLQAAYVGLGLAAWGLWALVGRARAWGVALALLFVGCVLYAANYEIRDLDSYLLAAVLALALLSAAGLARLRSTAGTRVAVAAAAALLVVNVAINYGRSDEHDLELPRDLTINLLQGLPPHSVLLSTQWDHLVSPSYALQELDGVRRDVRVIDPELLRRTWYVDELARQEPDLARRAGSALDAFRRDVAPFERGRPYDARVVQASYLAMVDSLIQDCRAQGRPVFVTLEVDPAFAPGASRVPVLLARQLAWDAGYVPEPEPRWTFRPWRGRIDAHVTMTHRLYAEALVARAAYELDHGHPDRAAAMVRRATEFDPGIDVNRMPPMALDGPESVREVAEFFERLRRAPGVAAKP